MATRRPKVPRAQIDGAASLRPRAGASAGPSTYDDGATTGAQGPATDARPNDEPTALRSQSAATGARAATTSGKSRLASATDAARGSAGASWAKIRGTGRSPQPAESTTEDPRPVPATAFSGRLLALAVVLVAITILLAPTVRTYLAQRAEIASLQADIAAKEKQKTALQKDLSRWDDPNYVKAQARDRVNMVMPGDTGYWVYGDENTPAKPDTAAGAGSAATSANPSALPWVDGLWQSIARSATE
ncbi:MAG: septum formation initiator family protein [Acidobacteria bacterium]|nr:septum formation initiator family protein [Acidobacteriota bacterium]